MNLFQSAFSNGQGKSISQLIAVRFSVQVIAHLQTTQKAPILQISKENRKKLTLFLAPSTRFERVAFRLGGGRSIQLSYEGVLTCTNLLERLPIRIGGKKRVNLCVLRRRTLYPAELRGRMELQKRVNRLSRLYCNQFSTVCQCGAGKKENYCNRG